MYNAINKTIIIFPRNVSFREYYVFVSTAAASAAAYGSEMAKNAIESEFRTSNMADRSVMARNAI